jgi:DNA-directed RNA polymerase specialized sigma24 family protein
MGRPRATPESRVASLDEQLRVQLLLAWELRKEAGRYLEAAEDSLRQVVTYAHNHGASVRDVAAVLGIPRSTVHAYVKPRASRRRVS